MLSIDKKQVEEAFKACREKLAEDIKKAREHLETAEMWLNRKHLLFCATQLDLVSSLLDYDNFQLSIFDCLTPDEADEPERR